MNQRRFKLSQLRMPSLAVFTLAACSLAMAISSHRVDAADPIPLSEAIATQLQTVLNTPSADAYNDLGNLLGLNGDFEAAEKAYRSALELEPQRADALYNLGLLLHSRGRLGEAMKLFQRVLKERPESAWTHFQVGLIHHERGQRKAAVRSIARAFELQPELSFADVNPQVIGNDSATAALLIAEVRATSAVPRIYSNPDRMVTLLTSDLETGGETGMAEETSEEEGSPRPQASAGAAARPSPGSSLPPSEEELDSSGDAEPRTELVAPGRDEKVPEEDADESSTAAAPTVRVIDASSLSGRGANSGAGQAGSSQESGTMQRGTGRESTSGRPEASRFRPGRRSSARIDWDLVPIPAPAAPTSHSIAAGSD